jgi:hypothetical protein
VERRIYPWTVSVNELYINPTKHNGLLQSRHHHLIESQWCSWKISLLVSNNNHSLTHSQSTHQISDSKCVLIANKCVKFYYSDYQILRYHSKFLEDILTIRPQDRERCNMLLMLLVVSYFCYHYFQVRDTGSCEPLVFWCQTLINQIFTSCHIF